MKKRCFYCQEGGSNKFWNVEVQDSKLVVVFGKVGTNGRENVKEFDSPAKATKEAEKLIAEKRKKGYNEIVEGEAIPDKPASTPRIMDENLFWEIIGMFNWKKEGDDDDAVMKPAIKFLTGRSVEDIFTFHDILSEKLYALDGETWGKIVEQANDGYLSGDYFLYVRCCVVANGRDFYETVLNDPNKMPGDLEFESLLHIAEEAWTKKTKQKFEDYPHQTKFNCESFSNKVLWSHLKDK